MPAPPPSAAACPPPAQDAGWALWPLLRHPARWSVALRWPVGLTLLLLVSPWLSFDPLRADPQHYLALHTAAEVVSIAVSVMVFALAWNLRHLHRHGHHLLLGTALLAVAQIDLAHLLSYAGMPALVTPSGPEKAINFWLAARGVAALALLTAALLPERRWPPALLLGLGLAVPAGVVWVGLWHADLLPATFVPGQGLTLFKRGAEYALAASYGAASLLLLRHGLRTHRREWLWLAAAAWVQGLAELYFTLYLNVSDTYNLLGHAYKTVAYWLIYRALFVAGVAQPYRELAEQRSRLHTLLATTSDPIWLKDPHGVYLSCNAAFERLYGVPEARIVGRTDYDFVDRATADFFRANDSSAAQAGKPTINEEWLRFSDGYRGLFETTKTPVLQADGRLLGVLGVAHNITRQRALQQALQDSLRARNCLHQVFTATEDLHASLADQLPAVADALRRAWPDTSGTRACITLGGRDYRSPTDSARWPDDAAPHQHHDLALPGDPSATIRIWHHPAMGQGAEAAPLEHEPPADGQQLLQPVAARLVSVVQQRDTRRQLLAREAIFLAIAEQAEDAIALIDLVSGRFVEFNDAAPRTLGYTRTEFAALTTVQVDASHDPAVLRQQALQARAQGHLVLEKQHRHRDGSTRAVLVRVRMLMLDGCAYLAAIWTDITELQAYRQHLEALVVERTRALAQAKDAAEAATQAKSTFLANMSHEIRTPLNAILGMAHLMRRAGVSPQQADRLAKIDAAGDHLLHTINAVLDLSKIEAGKLVLEHAPLSVGALVADVASMLAERAHAKGLSLRTETQATPHRLLGDPTRLRQALVNYAANAVKFSARGEVVLRAAVVTALDGEVLLRFEVQDSGPGIAAEALPRLFTAFEQADAATTRRFGGTGLGLAVTRRLVEAMGGEVGVHSVPGQGSTFWFTARLQRDDGGTAQDGPATPDEAELQLRARHAGARLLVAEDEPINREVLLCLLQDCGLQVQMATDGAQAVALVQQQPFDLVLMDMQMPGTDGLQATRQIRALPQGARLPVLAFTANAFMDDKARCLDAGMNDFITKPVDPAALFATVLRWLDAPPRA